MFQIVLSGSSWWYPSNQKHWAIHCHNRRIRKDVVTVRIVMVILRLFFILDPLSLFEIHLKTESLLLLMLWRRSVLRMRMSIKGRRLIKMQWNQKM